MVFPFLELGLVFPFLGATGSILIKGFLPGASVGSICQISPSTVEKPFLAEVVGFKDRSVLMMPLGDSRGVGLGSKIVLAKQVATIRVGQDPE